MKVCFVGLGSIGRQHLKNLVTVFESRKVSYIVDALRATSCTLPSEVSSLLHRQYTNVDDLSDKYDIAFICNPTNLHYDAIQMMLPKARHFFIEKPLFDVPRDISDFSVAGSVFYVACPLRYTSVFEYLKQNIVPERVLAVRAICSSYLPEWRPTQDYSKTYSSWKKMGGGVALDLIHEWDYLFSLFGWPQSVVGNSGHFSSLQGDSDDCAVYLAQYENMLLSLHLDYFGRFPRREVEFYTQDEVIVGDFSKQQVRKLQSNEMIDLLEEPGAHKLRELEAFLDMLEGAPNTNPPEIASRMMQLALTTSVRGVRE